MWFPRRPALPKSNGQARGLAVALYSGQRVDHAALPRRQHLRQGKMGDNMTAFSGPMESLARRDRVSRNTESVAAEHTERIERGAIAFAGKKTQTLQCR